MSNSPVARGFISLALLLCRLSLGAMFCFAGFRKLWPAGGFSDYSFVDFFKAIWTNVETFSANVVMTSKPAWLPDTLGSIYGHSLPFVELVTGALLALGFLTRVNAALITLMLVSFMIAYDIAWWPEQGPAFDKNIILATLSFLLILTGGGVASLDRLIFGRRDRDDD